MAVNPVVRISKPREAQGRTRFLSDEETERLLVTCKSNSKCPFVSHCYPGVIYRYETRENTWVKLGER